MIPTLRERLQCFHEPSAKEYPVHPAMDVVEALRKQEGYKTQLLCRPEELRAWQNAEVALTGAQFASTAERFLAPYCTEEHFKRVVSDHWQEMRASIEHQLEKKCAWLRERGSEDRWEDRKQVHALGFAAEFLAQKLLADMLDTFQRKNIRALKGCPPYAQNVGNVLIVRLSGFNAELFDSLELMRQGKKALGEVDMCLMDRTKGSTAMFLINFSLSEKALRRKLEHDRWLLALLSSTQKKQVVQIQIEKLHVLFLDNRPYASHAHQSQVFDTHNRIISGCRLVCLPGRDLSRVSRALVNGGIGGNALIRTHDEFLGRLKGKRDEERVE